MDKCPREIGGISFARTQMESSQMVKTCPSCDRPAGALTADPHCKSKACTWNKCNCGATYDRNKGRGFANTPKPTFYPGLP